MRSKFKWIFTLLLALSMQFSFAQEKTVTGTITDGKLPLSGANVVIKGSAKGVSADLDGKYSIKAKPGDVLVVSFSGYEKKSITVGSANNYKVVLKETSKVLEDVVVNGYRNSTKKKDATASKTIKAATIENQPNASFIQTLQGQIAGVNISTGTGQPGSKSTVIIRGVGSINGDTDPLYVIDGIPSYADNFRSINPNDIESTTVLKDAAAISVYGNRGANGVIIVKTKKTGFGETKTKFRYSSTSTFTQLQQPRYKFANSSQLLSLEKTYGAGFGSILTDSEIQALSNINTDWVKYFFLNAEGTNHQFSVEQTGKNLSSYSSVSYTDQKGILNTTGLKRFTLKNNLNGKSENGKFRYETNLTLGFSKNNEATSLGTGGINRNYVLGATLGMPYLSPNDYNGSQDLVDLYQGNPTLLYTPLFLMDKLATYDNNTDETRVLASADLSYNITKDLNFKVRPGTELVLTRFTQSEHPISFNALLFKNPSAEFAGFEDVNNRREFSFNNLFQLNYTKDIGKHSFNLILNNEYFINQMNLNNTRQLGLNPQTFVSGTGSGYLDDIAAHDFYGARGSVSKLKYNLISYFAIFDYDFDNRFGVSASYRKDGTSKFIGPRRWGDFWSVGARWNLDNESFIQKLDIFQTLKLRASYGIVGNQFIVNGTQFAGINPPLNMDTYGIASNVYDGQNGSSISFGDADLRWETTKTANIGLDFAVYKNRIRGSFDVYEKKTIDLFDRNDTSYIIGTDGIQGNSPIVVTNKGLEVDLAFDVIKNENLKLTLRGNGSFNENRISNFPDPGFRDDGLVIQQNGGPANQWYVIPYAGVNQTNGELLFLDINGNPTETPSVDRDRRATGKSAIPVIQGGFGFDFSYRGFFASSTMTFVQRVWRFDYDLEGLYDPTAIGQFVVSPDLLNAWTPTNTNTDIPSLNAANKGSDADSDRFLRDASYLRLRDIRIGYDVPKKFLEKTYFSGVSFYVQGQNLFTITSWTGFDAESNRSADQGQYPTPKIYSFGLDLKF
ncbi:SusC/RagA family TonB-linked outer membrane protein [Flavobacterium sp.]|uniref:SusC/RagA family TonB-linked outer membrane protein n=1 Tax=Flavobacterium sp. TaxID=239 RepID=UPI00334024CE